MPDLSLRQIEFHSDLVSKPVRDNFTDTENAINNLQDQIDLLTTTPGGTEVTNARDYHTVLRDRLRSDSLGRGNVLVSGGLVTAQGSPNMTVAVSAGEAVIGGIACKWTSQNSGTITAPATGRYDIVVVNSDCSISIVTGNDSADKVLGSVSSTQKALAVITLSSGTTSITNSLIRDCSEQGCHANGHYFWKIQDAVDSLNDRTNELDEGEIVIHKGNYYEEVVLTAFSNVTLRYDAGARHYRPSATQTCVKAVNTAGNEETFLKIIGGQFYGNGKSGAIANVRLEYCDDVSIIDCKSDGNTSSSATYKDYIITECDRLKYIGESDYVELRVASTTAFVSDSPFIFDTEVSDTGSIWNAATGVLTAKIPGIYHVDINIFPSAAVAPYISINSANSAAYKTINRTCHAASSVPVAGSKSYSLVQGDTLALQATSTVTLFQDECRMTVYRK